MKRTQTGPESLWLSLGEVFTAQAHPCLAQDSHNCPVFPMLVARYRQMKVLSFLVQLYKLLQDETCHMVKQELCSERGI